MTRGFRAVVLVLTTPMLACSQVGAAPLDAATCGHLKGEQVRLEQSGVRANMAKGPDWAKANLAADKLQEIRRLLELDEQLLFRCSGQNLVELPLDADPDPAAAPPEGKEDAKAELPKADAQPAGQNKAPVAKSPPSVQPKSPAADAKPKDATKAAAQPPKAPQPANKQAPVKATGAAPVPDKAAAPPKPKPKPKVDDAYKPPPPNPNVDPFARQSPPQ